MQFDVRKLQLGDFLWVARERTTPTPGTSLQSSVFCVKLWTSFKVDSHVCLAQCVSYVAKSLRIRWEGRLCFFTWYSNSVDQPAVCVLGEGRGGGGLRNFVLPYSYFFIMKMLGTSWIIRTRSLVAFDSRERSTSASPVIIFAGDLESMENGLAMTAFIFSLFLFKHIIQI